MAHTVVKILTNDDGDEYENPQWHLSWDFDGSDRTFCGGEVYGLGESIATYKSKSVEKGGITCGRCLAFIKQIKSVKL